MFSVAMLMLLTGWLQTPEQGIVVPRPPDVSDDEWARIQRGYQSEKREFARALVEFERIRQAVSQSTPAEILHRVRDLRDVFAPMQSSFLSSISRELALNYVGIRIDTAPRLSGRIVEVGPGGDHETLKQAIESASPGDTILLGEGTFVLTNAPVRRGSSLEDIAIVGMGAERTTLAAKVTSCRRLRLAKLTLDCNDSPAFILRFGATLELQDCLVEDFGARGGAIQCTNGVLLVERCTFDGRERDLVRASLTSPVFDLVGESLLLVRNSMFVEAGVIAKASYPCVLDGCKVTGDSGRVVAVIPGMVLVRDSEVDVSPAESGDEFLESSDDREVVARALEQDEPADSGWEASLARSLAYWIGLLRHDDPATRDAARWQLESLAGLEVETAAPSGFSNPGLIDQWLDEIEDPEPQVRERALQALRAVGDSARSHLEKSMQSRSPAVRQIVQRILRFLDVRRTLHREREYSRLIQWYQENRDLLAWDEEQSRYVRGTHSTDR